MDKLTETLSDEGFTDELAFVNARTVTLDSKYMGGDVCDPNPCFGGGRCTVVYEEPVCECDPASGTYGQYCELHVCDNDVNPCLNGATCGHDPTDGSATCACTDSYDGDFCEREICGDLAEEYAEEQRCAQEYGDDEQNFASLEECLQYAVDNGAEYFSWSESQGRCRLPSDAQDQCVTNPETGYKSWTIYTVGVDYESCIPCEDSHETTCEQCSCSESAEDERYDGVRFETCFEHAMNAQKFFFSYNSRKNRCVIPASSGQCNQYNRQADAYSRFNVYEVVYCDPPHECDENGDTASIHQTGAYCQKLDVDIRDKNIGSVQACVDLAVANGASMFSMKIMTTYWGQTFHMCRIPMHNVMHQCTVEQENHSEDWNIYKLSGGCVTTPEPTFEINNPIETCPEIAEHGDSCFEYVRGMVCDIDHHCCCGVCAYGGVATCEEDGTWSTAMRETLYDQGCNRNSCKYNDWSDKDCNQAKKNGDCFGYYDTCKASCGFDFNLEQAIADAGIDEEAIEEHTSDNTCLNNADFVDSNGFNCYAYEGAGWCQREAGVTTYGVNWCHRYPRSDFETSLCHVMPSRLRQYTFGHYVNDVGEDARVCCCDNDLFDSYNYDLGWDMQDNPHQHCNDKQWPGFPDRPWHDKNGWTCRAYAYGNLCTTEGKKTYNWNTAEWGTIQDNAETPKKEEDRMHAFEACCACGGGDPTPNYDDIQRHFLSKVHKHCNSGYIHGNGRCWNRLKQRMSNIMHQSSYENVDPAQQHYVEELYSYATQYTYTQENYDTMKAVWNEFMGVLDEYNLQF